MPSLLERPVSFRLPEPLYAQYQTEAYKLGLGLSAYLRMRLTVEDGVREDQLAQLRLALLDTETPQPSSRSAHFPIALELLLLMRRMAWPADLRAVHQELERQGCTPWTPGPVSEPDA